MSHDKDFLSFDEAVELTHNLEDFFNSPQSDNTLEYMRQRFNLDYRPNFVLSRSNVVRNHHECTGCSGGSCVLGCYMSHNGTISYWDKALTKIIGARLVTHEVGHKIYEEIFTDGLPPDEHFNRSEEFAQFVENSYNRYMHFVKPHPMESGAVMNKNMNFETNDGSFTGAVVGGIAFGLGVALATVLMKMFSKKVNGK